MSDSESPVSNEEVEDKLRRIHLSSKLKDSEEKCDSSEDLCKEMNRCLVTRCRNRNSTTSMSVTCTKTKRLGAKPLLRKSRLLVVRKSPYIRKPKLNIVKFEDHVTFDAADSQADESESTNVHPSTKTIQSSCSQQALNPYSYNDDTIEELAAYFECYVHIPKKMSQMA